MSEPQRPDDPTVDRKAARRRTIGFIAVVVVLAALAFGIWRSVHYTLPDANDPATVRDTATAVAAIERDVARSTAGATSAACSARLLDRDGGDLLVHAVCVARPGPIETEGPYRVEPDGTVRTARPGPDFNNEVHDVLGSRLGDWYLNHLESFSYLRPPSPPGDSVTSPIPAN